MTHRLLHKDAKATRLRHCPGKPALWAACAVLAAASSVAAQTSGEPAVTLVYDAPSFAAVATQLAADRQFVSAALEQSQQKLTEIMVQNQAMLGQPADPAPGPDLFAQRIADFATAQSAIFDDYSAFLRLRSTGVAEAVDERADERAMLFAATGSIFGTPYGQIEPPASPPPPTVPVEMVPFPGLPGPVGGFFVNVPQTENTWETASSNPQTEQE